VGIAALSTSTTEHHLGRWRSGASRRLPGRLTQQRHCPGGR
jgi:hypothetical protein